MKGLQLVTRVSGAFSLQISSVLFAYIAQVILARNLSMVSYGQYSFLWTSIGLLTTIGTIGFSASAIRFIPEYLSNQRLNHAKSFISIGTAVSLFTSLAIGFGMLLYTRFVNSSSWYVALLAGIVVPVLVMSSLFAAFTQAGGSSVTAYTSSLLIRPALFLIMLLSSLVLSFRLNYSIAMMLNVFSTIVSAMIMWRIWIRKQRIMLGKPMAGSWLRRRPRWTIQRTWFEVSIWMLMSSMFQIGLNQADTIIIGVVRGPRDVAIYSVATKVAALTAFVLTAVNAVVTPKLSSAVHSGDYKGLQRLVSQSANLIFWPSLFISLIIIFGGHELTKVFGTGYLASYVPMVILTIGQLVNGWCGSVAYLLNVSEKHKLAVTIFGVGAGLNVVSNLVIVPHFGPTGAAVVTAFTMVFWNIWMHQAVVKHLKVYPSFFATWLRTNKDSKIVQSTGADT